jgi:hypothetical protein
LKGKSLEGTDSKVYISLIDDKTETERIWLTKNNATQKRNLFESGKMNEFAVHTSTSLSKLNKIRIGHDNSGFGPGWHLNKVVLLHKQTGKSYVFSCNRWLAKDEDDGRIERVLSSLSDHSSANRSESARSVNSVASSKNSKSTKPPIAQQPPRPRRDSNSEDDGQSKKKQQASNRKSSSVSSDEKFDKLFDSVQSPIKDMRGSSRNSDIESKSQDSSFDQLLLQKGKNKYDVKKEPSLYSISDDDLDSTKKQRNFI